ncbi:MAG: VacB/RNase II family 3'-5' exoribonuclease [Gammaproteobacteria bacterium]|nr:VacB/RNase II family 3'-5' exoribonuclease [Gammaproteobacteria bacterium]
MLNSDSLAQLKALKSEIQTQQQAKLKQGTVRGSQGRFGFVMSEEGESFFLAPDEMAKVFPGDVIQFSETTDDKDKIQAVPEKLISTEFKVCTGRFQKRGKAQFVEPDTHTSTHWLYIPPDACEGIEDNDWVICEVTRHPFKNGKPQGKIVRKIGKLSDAGFERQYAIEKFQLSHEWPETTFSELALLAEENIEAMAKDRENLTHIPYVTIDSEHTRDMDDALYAKATDNGWILSVAIADPSSWFGMNTNLDQEAARRCNSLYFPGRSLPMLPQELSNGLCSLLENKDRLALVCDIELDKTGAVIQFEFKEALVRSQGKLSYQQVTQFIEGDANAVDASLADHLMQLHLATQALNQYRSENNLIMEDRADYYLTVGDNGKLQSIYKAERNVAQKLVEEAMLVANLCCARHLQTLGTGIYIQHPGFRTERIGDIKTIIEQQGIEFEGDFTTAEGYKAFIKAVEAKESDLPLKTILSRFLTRSEFSVEAGPHTGMGFDCYTTFTSPIRKYNDLVVHRIIKASLGQQKCPEVDATLIDKLQTGLVQGRQAVNLAENWLKLQFLENMPQTEFAGRIVQTNIGGCTVQLTDIGIEGFVDLRKSKERLNFDKMYLRHSNDKTSYQLDQDVTVKIKNIDVQGRKLDLTFV